MAYDEFTAKMVRRVDALEQALAEKDREIQQIREHEFQRGYREGESVMLDKAVRFAQYIFTTNNIYTQNPVYKEAQSFLEEQT